jgi:hypothetical protein
MQIEFKSTNPAIDDGILETFQRELGARLPRCYKDFLLQYNGGRPVKNVFPIADFDEGNFGSIQVFFGLNTIVKTSDLSWRIKNRIAPFPAGLLEIACTDGSDLICIDTQSENVPVYFFDYASSWGNGIWRDEDLYLIATSFADFLFKLKEKN